MVADNGIDAIFVSTFDGFLIAYVLSRHIKEAINVMHSNNSAL